MNMTTKIRRKLGEGLYLLVQKLKHKVALVKCQGQGDVNLYLLRHDFVSLEIVSRKINSVLNNAEYAHSKMYIYFLLLYSQHLTERQRIKYRSANKC